MRSRFAAVPFISISLAVSLTIAGSCSGGGGGGRSFGIRTRALDKGTDGQPYSFFLKGAGGKKPYAWSITAGSLPGGLALDGATGEISGTVGTTESRNSPYPITVRLADSSPNVREDFEDFLLVVEPPGGTGGGPMRGSVTVTVVEKETSLPLAGAFVMIGEAPDDPFPGNFGTTDASGEITFNDAALNRPPTPPPVTAGADLRQYVTIFGANASEFVLPLKTIVDGSSIARISGDVTMQNTSSGDFHGAFVIPPLKLTQLFDFRIEKLFAGEECVCFACDKIVLPGNLSYPQQDVFAVPLGDDVLQKSYFVDLEEGTRIHLAAGSGFIDSQTLLNFIGGGNPNRIELFTQLEMEGFGFVPDYTVSGPDVVDIPITVGLGASQEVRVESTPRGVDAFFATGADITAFDGTGQILASDFGFAPRDGSFPSSEVMATVPSTIPGIGDPHEIVVAAAFYDPFSKVAPLPTPDVENAFSFLADRTTPFGTGIISVDGFLDLIPLDPATDVTNGGRTFTYSSARDASNPSSPVPDFTLSQISRAWEEPQPPLVDPFPGDFCDPKTGLPGDCDDLVGSPPSCPPPSNVTFTEIYWEAYTPGSTSETTFTLPTLPGSAPRASDGGLFDPAATAEPDGFRWTVFSFAATLDPGFDYDAFTFGAVDDSTTHVSINFASY